MATRSPRIKVGWQLLGLIAVLSSIMFCLSSFLVYKSDYTLVNALGGAAGSLTGLSSTSKSLYSSDTTANSYYKIALQNLSENDESRRSRIALAIRIALLAECLQATREGDSIEFSLTYRSFIQSHLNYAIYKRKLSNSPDDYVYERLWLVSELKKGDLSSTEYQDKLNQLILQYSKIMPQPKTRGAKKSLRLRLNDAEQQNAKLQVQVDSLKEQLAKAEHASREKWLAITIAALSLLVALSSNIIAWRIDRRQSREAKLLPFKQRDLEQNIALKDQQAGERNKTIITPTAHELQLYSVPVPKEIVHEKDHKKHYR